MSDVSTGLTLFVGPPGDPDRYRLGALAGAGSEGVLYRGSLLTASGVVLDVAVKMLHPRFASRIDAFGRRWREQVELFRSLQAPGMVTVRDGFTGPLPHRAGEADGTSPPGLYLVMNWVDGDPLDTWAANHPNASAAERLKLLLPVAAALDLAHSGMATGGVAVVHCDVKPANILVTSESDAVLVDIGLTRVLPGGGRSTAVTGTPGYLSPEVLANGEYSPASDRYALGMVAWSLLTGLEPPPGYEPDTLQRELSDAYPDRPDLVAHVLAMLDAQPQLRPALLANWCAQLRNSSLPPGEDSDPLAPLAPVQPQAAKKRHRPTMRRSAAIAGGVVLAALLVAAGNSAVNRGSTPTVHVASGSTSTSATTADVGTVAASTATTAHPTRPTAMTVGPVVVAPPATCANAALGYSVTLPPGWQANSQSPTFSACQLFSTKAIDPAAVTANALAVPIEFGSLAYTPADLAAGETNVHTVVVAGLKATVVDTTLTDTDLPAGTRTYTYLIDRGRTTLVAVLVTAPGTTATQRTASQRALDAMVGSLNLQAPECQDSYDPRCGDFYWAFDPATNDQITQVGPISVTPAPTVGAPVKITVSVTDPDADVLDGVQVCYGDAPCNGALPMTDFCYPLCLLRQVAAMVGPHGPWKPPPVHPGTRTFTYQHTYNDVGRYHFSVHVRASNSSALAGHDPYQSEGTFDLFIDVH